MPRTAAVLACFVALCFSPIARAADPLPTTAEKTDYKSTSTYADVVAFCDELAKRSPLVKLSTFGTSHEGRKLPLMVIADPPVTTPEEAKKSGKLVALVFANIHAGEVDGKEAALALARDLTAEKGHPLLKDLVILFVPILNADGNEKFGRNRPGQNGPPETGIRFNAQGFDLNRDFVKLESPEIRALVGLYNAWDPSLVMDLHTTNGSRHRHTLTYDGPRYPSSDAPLSKWWETTMIPDVTKKVKAAAGFDLAPYGNFSQDRTKWETYGAGPRFSTQYLAMRNRMGVLSESYSYATFKDRVLASYAFTKACLESAAAHKEAFAKLYARDPKAAGTIGLKTETVAAEGKWPILGFEEEMKDGKRVITDRPKTYSLDYVARIKPTVLVKIPPAYLVPASFTTAIETLKNHGIAVEPLKADTEMEVEAYPVARVDKARAFQGHELVTVEVEKPKAGTRRIPAGTVVVKTDQPLGELVAYLLEPQSEDGLVTWNFFDKELAKGKDFPVLRLVK